MAAVTIVNEAALVVVFIPELTSSLFHLMLMSVGVVDAATLPDFSFCLTSSLLPS